MELIFLSILTGTALGAALHHREKLIRLFDRALWGVIFLLLFLLGFSIGRNPQVMASLGELGLHALLLALGSLFGSVLVTAWIDRLFKVVTSESRGEG